ncbi:MAG: hypothetical protein QOE64_1139 [Frankiales bacterium]|jgi:hypothetical protein|nr:hypothetical protein [Frankiales bacterium]
MSGSGSIRREVRRQIRRPGVAIDVVADVNAAVATNGEAASSTQSIHIKQEHGASVVSHTDEEEQ